jgi:hypothetical protein
MFLTKLYRLHVNPCTVVWAGGRSLEAVSGVPPGEGPSGGNGDELPLV